MSTTPISPEPNPELGAGAAATPQEANAAAAPAQPAPAQPAPAQSAPAQPAPIAPAAQPANGGAPGVASTSSLSRYLGFNFKFAWPNIILICLSFLLIMATFLPFVSAGQLFSASLISQGGDGVLFIVAALFLIIVSVAAMFVKLKPVGFVPAVIAFLISLIALVDTVAVSNKVSEFEYSAMIQLGAGYYLLFFVGFMLLIAALFQAVYTLVMMLKK